MDGELGVWDATSLRAFTAPAVATSYLINDIYITYILHSVHNTDEFGSVRDDTLTMRGHFAAAMAVVTVAMPHKQADDRANDILLYHIKTYE